MKKLFTVFALAATALSASAQDLKGTSIEDRVPAADLQTVKESISLYRDAFKEGKYAEAYEPWKIAFEKGPLAQSRTYTDGAYMLEIMLSKETDDAKKKEYFDMLMKVYDTRLKNLDALNSFATEKTTTTKGNILTRKADDIFRYSPSQEDRINVAYPMFKDGIEDMGANDVPAYALFDFITLSEARYQYDKDNNREDFINDYMMVNDVCEELLEQAKEYAFTDSIATKEDSIKAAELEEKAAKIVAKYQPTQIQCITLFNNSGAASCDALATIYQKKVEDNKDNKEYLKRVLAVLNNFECNESALFGKIVSIVYPSTASSGGSTSKTSGGTSSASTSTAYLMEEYKTATGAKKAKIAYNLAALAYKAGKIGECQKWANEAGKLGNGNAYLLLASCVVRQAKGDALEKSKYYCLAIDKCNKAKAIDPSCAGKANSTIASYRGGLYPKSEAFFNGLKEGQAVTVLGERTTLRFR